MNSMRLTALTLSALLLTGCTQSAAAPEEQRVYFMSGNPVDVSFFRSPVRDETAEERTPVDPLYDTQIISADNKVLADLTDGEWVLTEDGEQLSGLMETVTPDAVIGPDIHNRLRISTELTAAATDILREGNIEGCVIVTDPKGQVELICNNPPDKNYASAPNFNGSTAKLFVSTAMLDHETELSYDDPGYYDNSFHRYYNHDTSVPYAQPVTRDLLNAFTVSSNAYFMHAACDLLTHADMLETYNKYYGYNVFGGGNGHYFPADWMQIPQPEWSSIADNSFERGKSAIGLSDQVKITPLYLNAVTGAIASGALHQLNLRADSPVHQLTETEPLPEEMQSTLWELMDSCAKWTNRTFLAPLNDYQFYIKTGTADTRYGQNNEFYLKRLLITGFLAKDGEPELVITMYCHNGAESGLGGGGSMSQYYRKIAELMLSA